MTDKAVSTEDLCVDLQKNASLEAARLEAVIKTLIENKVDSLKNSKRKSSSLTSSPKNLFNKLKGNSTSTVSSSRRCELNQEQEASPPKRRKDRRAEKNLHFSDDQKEFITYHGKCYCKKETTSEIHVHMDDDFISLNMEEYDEKEMEAMRALRRAQRKKRRRRKQRQMMKKQLAMSAAVTVPVKHHHHHGLDDDELSERARLAIVLTAALLLFMCLLLVGITLRMAPLIDDMVRKENEELMNSLAQDSTGSSSNNDHYKNSLENLTASVPFSLK